MTKAEIVQAVYAIGGFSKKESADVVDLVFEMMKETLGRGEKIKISGFGNFVLRDKRQRPGRNPQTGDPIKISERRVLTFKASQILKQVLNAVQVVPAGTGSAQGNHSVRPSGAAPQPGPGAAGSNAPGRIDTGIPPSGGTVPQPGPGANTVPQPGPGAGGVSQPGPGQGESPSTNNTSNSGARLPNGLASGEVGTAAGLSGSPAGAAPTPGSSSGSGSPSLNPSSSSATNE